MNNLTEIENEILTAIAKRTLFSVYELCLCYFSNNKSIDKLITCIVISGKLNIGLSGATDILNQRL